MKRLAWAMALAVALAGVLPGETLAADHITNVPTSIAYGSTDPGTTTGAGTLNGASGTATNMQFYSDSQAWNWTVTWSAFTDAAGDTIPATARQWSVKTYTNNCTAAGGYTAWFGGLANGQDNHWIAVPSSAQRFCASKLAAGYAITLNTTRFRVVVPANTTPGAYSGTTTFAITH